MKNHTVTLYATKGASENSSSEKLVAKGLHNPIIDDSRHHYGWVNFHVSSLLLFISAKFYEGSHSMAMNCKNLCFDGGVFFRHAIQYFLKKISKPFLLLFVLSLAFACSDTTTAERGTGSDGESFIYGVTVDSLSTKTLFASEIILARVEWVDSEYQETDLDTVYSDLEGNFSLFPADTGEYMLRLNWNDSLYAQIRNLSFAGDTLALGKVGLYRSIQVSGGLPLPECAKAVVKMVGFPETVLADSTGSFVLDAVHAGRGELVASCEGSTYSWTLVLSGACREASLGTLKKISSNSKQHSGLGTVGGSQNLQKQSQPIVVDAHCNVK